MRGAMGYGLSIGGTTAVVGLGGLTGLAFYNGKWVNPSLRRGRNPDVRSHGE